MPAARAGLVARRDARGARGDRRSNTQLWIADRRGRRARLTNDVPADPLAHFAHCCAAWSADGSQIAFLSDVGRGQDLYVVGSDGRGERRLTWGGVVGRPSFSPDGSLIALARSRGELEVVPASGGAVRVLTRRFAWDATWRPRPVRAARQPPVTAVRVAPHAVRVPRRMLPTGRARLVDVRPLGTGGDFLGNFADISPDGALLSYVRYDRGHTIALGVLDLRTNRRRLLARGAAPWNYAVGGGFSPDGRFLLLRRWRSLLAIDVRTGRESPLAEDPSSGPAQWIRGDRLAYVDRRGRLLAVRPGGRPQTLGFTAPARDAVALAPDGRSVVYGSGCSARLRDLATGRDRLLTRGPFGPGPWSPDGAHFLLASGDWQDGCKEFYGSPTGGYDLYAADGTRLGSVGMGYATWSSDGRWLFLQGGTTGTEVTYLQRLWVVSMRTLRVAPLLRDRACGSAFAGPGDWVVLCRYAAAPREVIEHTNACLPTRLYLARLALPRRAR